MLNLMAKRRVAIAKELPANINKERLRGVILAVSTINC